MTNGDGDKLTISGWGAADTWAYSQRLTALQLAREWAESGNLEIGLARTVSVAPGAIYNGSPLAPLDAALLSACLSGDAWHYLNPMKWEGGGAVVANDSELQELYDFWLVVDKGLTVCDKRSIFLSYLEFKMMYDASKA